MDDNDSGMVYERWWLIEHKGQTFYVRAWDQETAVMMFLLWDVYGFPEVDWVRTSHPTDGRKVEMPKQLDRDMAFAAGKLAGENAFNDDKLEDMLFYGREISKIPEPLMEDWKSGFNYAADNVENANYVETDSHGKTRVALWLNGTPLPEESQANIMVNPKTVDRVQVWQRQEPSLDMDTIINLALDCFAHYYDLWFGAEMSGDTTEAKVKARFAKAHGGQTYWDTIEEEQGVHYGETS